MEVTQSTTEGVCCKLRKAPLRRGIKRLTSYVSECPRSSDLWPFCKLKGLSEREQLISRLHFGGVPKRVCLFGGRGGSVLKN